MARESGPGRNKLSPAARQESRELGHFPSWDEWMRTGRLTRLLKKSGFDSELDAGQEAHLHQWYRVKAKVSLGKEPHDAILEFNNRLDEDSDLMQFAEDERMVKARRIISESLVGKDKRRR